MPSSELYKCRLKGLHGEHRGDFTVKVLQTYVQCEEGRVYARAADVKEGVWTYTQITLEQVASKFAIVR